MSYETVKFDLLIANKKKRELLLVMYLVVPNGDWISGTGLSFWLGGQWSTARKNHMADLAYTKWVECKLMPREAGSRVGRWNYRLTDDAINTMGKIKKDSAYAVITGHTSDLFDLAGIKTDG